MRKQRAYAAQMQALEGGRSGAVVAGKTRLGAMDRWFSRADQSNGCSAAIYHTIYIDGRPQSPRQCCAIRTVLDRRRLVNPSPQSRRHSV